MAFNNIFFELRTLDEIVSCQYSDLIMSDCLREARDICKYTDGDFLLTPGQNVIWVNKSEMPYKNISMLLHLFITDEYSLVIVNQTKLELSNFISDLLNKNINYKKTYHDILIEHNVRIVYANLELHRLKGGSFSKVELFIDKNRWRISKRIIYPKGDEDADIRLYREGVFVTGLPDCARRLFPDIRQEEIYCTPELIGYQMEYCPFPTLGELVITKQVDPFGLIKCLEVVCESLIENMYVNKFNYCQSDDNYFKRISRRIKRINDTPSDIGITLKKLLLADQLVINGERCEGFYHIYRKLIQCNELSTLAFPPVVTLCHGDLILEDILMNPFSREFKVIPISDGVSLIRLILLLILLK